MTDWYKIFKQRGLPLEMITEIRHGGGFRETVAIERLQRSIREYRRIIVLSGDPGCGKTAAALWACCGTTRARFVDAALFQIGGMFQKRLPDLLEVPLLVIDDLGVEFMDEKGAFATMLDAVINQRYQSGKTTILTTNLDSEDFAQRYGDRILDRIRGSGKFWGITCESMRVTSPEGPVLRLPIDDEQDADDPDGTLDFESIKAKAEIWLKTHRVNDEPDDAPRGAEGDDDEREQRDLG